MPPELITLPGSNWKPPLDNAQAEFIAEAVRSMITAARVDFDRVPKSEITALITLTIRHAMQRPLFPR